MKYKRFLFAFETHINATHLKCPPYYKWVMLTLESAAACGLFACFCELRKPKKSQTGSNRTISEANKKVVFSEKSLKIFLLETVCKSNLNMLRPQGLLQ